MRSIIINLFINHCRENLEYYKKVFGGEIKQVVPSQEQPDKLIHAELYINENCVLYFCDSTDPNMQQDGYHIVLSFNTEEEIRRVYDALKPGSEIVFELQVTFWGSYHAVLTDKNGITWGLDAPKE